MEQLIVEIACPGLAMSRHAIVVADDRGAELASRVVYVSPTGGWRVTFDLASAPAVVTLTGAHCNAREAIPSPTWRLRLTPGCGPAATFLTPGDPGARDPSAAVAGVWAPDADVPAACRIASPCAGLIAPLLAGAPLPDGPLGPLAACLDDPALDDASRLHSSVLAWPPVHTPPRPARTAALVERAAATGDLTLLATLRALEAPGSGAVFSAGDDWYLGRACGCAGDGGADLVGETLVLRGDRTPGARLIRLESRPALVICACNGAVPWVDLERASNERQEIHDLPRQRRRDLPD